MIKSFAGNLWIFNGKDLTNKENQVGITGTT